MLVRIKAYDQRGEIFDSHNDGACQGLSAMWIVERARARVRVSDPAAAAAASTAPSAEDSVISHWDEQALNTFIDAIYKRTEAARAQAETAEAAQRDLMELSARRGTNRRNAVNVSQLLAREKQLEDQKAAVHVSSRPGVMRACEQAIRAETSALDAARLHVGGGGQESTLSMLSRMLGHGPGLYFLSVRMVATGELSGHGAHALAFEVTNGSEPHRFFDPNYGEYVGNSLAQDVADHMDKEYGIRSTVLMTDYLYFGLS